MRKKRRPARRLLALLLCVCITMTQTGIVSAGDLEETALYSMEEASQSTEASESGTAQEKESPGTSTLDAVVDPEGDTADHIKEPEKGTEDNTDQSGQEKPGGETDPGGQADQDGQTDPGGQADQDSQMDPGSQSEEKDKATENLELYYKDGKICIYNYRQILLIGSGQPVHTGDIDENTEPDGDPGEAVHTETDVLTYGPEQKYCLMNDIEMDTDTPWHFPDAFAGTIEPYENREETAVYDEAADTIYIYNRYQLELMLSENAEEEPVMSEDCVAEKVGMGQPFILSDGSKLTYSSGHKYMLASSFTTETPELLANKVMTLADNGSYEGRDFAGQVIKEISGTEYILIGNKEQLQAIGSGDFVYTAVYQASKATATAISKWEVDKDSSGNPIMLYGGDADLAESQNGKKTYILGKPDKAGSNLLRITGRCGVNQSTGTITPDLDIDKASGHTYDANENYIIFRDIDLSNEPWTPLMFSGTMEGRLNMVEGLTVTVSNVSVAQSGPLDNSKISGVGFFGSIMNTSKNNIGISDQAVSVKNMKLQNVSVINESTKIKDNKGLISFILAALVAITGILPGNLDEALNSLLNPSKNVDETVFATGAFAGRISGQVTVENCTVDNITNLSNAADITGGFAGNIEGVTKYGELQDGLGVLVNVLKEVLNVIPFVDLGTLIEVLVGGGVLDVDKLIPTGYYSPQIINCQVTGGELTVGSADKNYNGGFAGRQIGAVIKDSSVSVTSLTVNGKNLAGGFSGLTANAELIGLLENLGVDVVKSIRLNSFLLNCSVNADTINISAADKYAGGLSGSMNNSFAVDSEVVGTVHIQATGYAGGITGRASLAQSIALGEEFYSGEKNLVSLLGNLLSGLLSDEQENSLLALTGISPSVLAGVSVSGELSVAASDSYAGGFVGAADGVMVIPSSELAAQSWVWSQVSEGIGYSPLGKSGTITELKTVQAKSYAGGMIGRVTTASASGILNKTLGIGNYLKFVVKDTIVTGTGDSSISAQENYAGGAFGTASGGDISEVNITNLKSVTAENYAGGFAGSAGTGSLAEANGLNILGLVTVSNLLSIGDGITTKLSQCRTSGTSEGMTVSATGKNVDGGVSDFIAGGFIGKCNSAKVENSAVENLKSVFSDVLDGYAGGFIGISRTGGLAEVSDETGVTSLIQAGNLVNAVGYLIPSYKACTVSYVKGGGVTADTAGGFAGDFQSGTVDNQANGEGSYYAVYNIDYVKGGTYAGGFGGRVYSGALASANNGGLSILGGLTGVNLGLDQLLSLIEAYVPILKYAGVKSEDGFTVSAEALKTNDAASGSAGGYIGYGSGVQISNCSVTKLKHTKVTEPADLEAAAADSYFGAGSQYSITAARYAGGYIGKMDVGDAASLGSGLKLLGNSILLDNILSALSVVVSTIEHSDVTGAAGGFSVYASNTLNVNGILGTAGGFAGSISGGHIQDSDAVNFSYVISQIAAGGYVGEFEPGNVADILESEDILGGLVSSDSALASVMEDFVPTIRNSSTTCIPCGGAVRAQAAADSTTKRGMAGGYVGHNEGGQILGLNTSWKGKPYKGDTSVCSAFRIRSVYGAEYAGGYSGLMEAADTAKTGSLSLLYGLVNADNLLGALKVVYPFEENTAVYGPLSNLDLAAWNSWVEAVGRTGGYGAEIAKSGSFQTQAELDAALSGYVYGYHVVAGRTNYVNQTIVSDGGCAGGYVGAMVSGVITNGQAHDAKLVRGVNSAGGFAGKMISGGAASLGGVNILGLNLDLGKLLNAVEVFIPVIKESSVEGYQTGLTVESMAEAAGRKAGCGNAGGYAGTVVGGQIWGDGSDADGTGNLSAGCKVTKLRRVKGNHYIGGYVGQVTAGSAADVSTNAGSGLLQGILDTLISKPNDLISLLQATAATIRGAEVSAADPSWGFVVEGNYKENDVDKYAVSAGGFAGSLEAAVLGDRKGGSTLTVNHLRGVTGGYYAGGFFGLADVGSVAKVSGNDASSQGTSILSLIQLGQTSVLDAFRTYIYHAEVNGVPDGITVQAYTQDSEGLLSEQRMTGNAGGFGGGLLNGSVKNSRVTNLNAVTGLNYAGGFIGHLGKNGAVDVDDAQIGDKLGLLGATAGVLDVFGSHVADSSVTGTADGFTVKSSGGEDMAAGGFAGYSDLSKLEGCTVDSLKKVTSGQIAGGFVGETKMNYIADVEVESKLVDVILKVVNELVKLLYLDKLENLGVIDLEIGSLLGLKVLSEGDLLYVNLLGLKIGVALSKNDPEYHGATDAAIITIGDSTIKLPCDNGGIKGDEKDITPQLEVTLIKGNRSNIVSSSVNGITMGYDVYGGGADDSNDGSGSNGYSGGFIGLNNEGVFENNAMTLCDVVRGTTGQTGPFAGKTELKSTYYFNTRGSIEGIGNHYRIYRPVNSKLMNALTAGMQLISTGKTDGNYNQYEVSHLDKVADLSDWENAVMAADDSGTEAVPIAVYDSPAKAVLMSDTTVADNMESLTPEPADTQDPCEQSVDVTIQKVWKDWRDWDGVRPGQISVKLFQSYTDADGKKITKEYDPDSDPSTENAVILTAEEDGSGWSSTWKKVVSGLPVAFADTDGTLYYYSYTVEESTAGYITSIEYDNTGYVVTITNQHDPELPLTGGRGMLWLVILGAVLAISGFYRYGKKKKGSTV